MSFIRISTVWWLRKHETMSHGNFVSSLILLFLYTLYSTYWALYSQLKHLLQIYIDRYKDGVKSYLYWLYWFLQLNAVGWKSYCLLWKGLYGAAYFFLSQGVVNSVKTRKKIACQDSAPRQAYLIGSATNIRPLQRDIQLKIASVLSVPVDLVSSSALFSKRCLLNDVGYDGTMCCCGDYVLIASNGQEIVVKIETMLSVNCGGWLM